MACFTTPPPALPFPCRCWLPLPPASCRCTWSTLSFERRAKVSVGPGGGLASPPAGPSQAARQPVCACSLDRVAWEPAPQPVVFSRRLSSPAALGSVPAAHACAGEASAAARAVAAAAAMGQVGGITYCHVGGMVVVCVWGGVVRLSWHDFADRADSGCRRSCPASWLTQAPPPVLPSQPPTHESGSRSSTPPVRAQGRCKRLLGRLLGMRNSVGPGLGVCLPACEPAACDVGPSSVAQMRRRLNASF